MATPTRHRARWTAVSGTVRVAARRHLEGRGSPFALAAVSALWAWVVSHDSAHPAHALWGQLATVAYAVSAVAALLVARRWARRSVLAVNLVGAVLVPLIVLSAGGTFQSEVGVVQRSGTYLVHTGQVYVPHPTGVLDYNPYLPAMALFGIPHDIVARWTPSGFRRDLLNVLGDPRPWFALIFLASLLLSWMLLRRPAAGGAAAGPAAGSAGSAGRRRRWAGMRAPLTLVGSPVIAFPLCVSGVDLPIVGLTCLTLAVAATGRPRSAGLLAAAAGALKWTAWPLLPVVALLVGTRRGWREGLRSLLWGAVALAATIVPAALGDPRAMIDQVLDFPLGVANIPTPASSPLPGHALWNLGVGGHVAVFVLLAAGAVAVSWWTLRRRPRTAVAAADRLAAGMSVVFALAPNSRFGYFVFPLVVWALTHLAAGRIDPRALATRVGAAVRRTAGRVPEAPELDRAVDAVLDAARAAGTVRVPAQEYPVRLPAQE